MLFDGNDAMHSSAAAVGQAQPITTAAVVIPSGAGSGHVVSGGAFAFTPMFFGSSGVVVFHNFGLFTVRITLSAGT